MRLHLPLLVAALVATNVAPAEASETLYDRNLAFLRTTVPLDGFIEVRTVEDGEEVVQLWTTEQYAIHRAAFATALGRDYTASFQGVPGGLGEQQYLGDIWTDFWGTTQLNLATPRGLTRTIDCCKLWFYGGSNSRIGVGEHDNQCYFDPGWNSLICSSTFGWTYPQSGGEHDDAWFAYSGIIILFPPPLGSLGNLNGAVFAQNL